MRIHFSRRIRLAAATGVAVVVLALVGAVGLRFLVGTASADPAAPNPGHPWSQVENHGIDAAGWWLGAGADQALELRLNGARVLRLEPISFNVIGGYSGNSVTAGAGSATIGGGGSSDSGANRVTDHCGTVSGGVDNQAGNGGAVDDQVCATVGGGAHNTASTNMSTVGGGASNTASGDNATVGGGVSNQAQGEGAALGGGQGNQASGGAATVGGGVVNTASGHGATVGGGDSNTASNDAATVGGGNNNQTSNQYATIGGGWANRASGQSATVPGGSSNTAQGNSSFAAGYAAQANHTGAFVWADSNSFYFLSTANNQFSARATGGVRFVLAIDGAGNPTWTCSVVAGGAWACASSRSLKENLVAADGRDVLERLSQVPVLTWNAKGLDTSVRHMGPLAEDFFAAFGVGEDNTHLDTIDLDGVALASIQGLYQISQEQAGRIDALEKDNASLKQGLDSLEARVTALESGTAASAPVSQASSSGLPAPWLFVGGGMALVLGGLVLVQRRLIGGPR